MQLIRATSLTIIALLVAVSATCGCLCQTASQPTQEKIARVDAVTENLLQSLNNGSYESFTHNFSASMKGAFNESTFRGQRSTILNASGRYLLKGQPLIQISGIYVAYIYNCTFQNENVTVRVVMSDDANSVEGLWYDSPKLREAFAKK